jgi:hypothetical protein
LLARPCEWEDAGAKRKHEYDPRVLGVAPHISLITSPSNAAQVTRVLPKSAKKNTIMA